MISPLWDLGCPTVYMERLAEDNYCWSLAWIVVGLRLWKGGRVVLSVCLSVYSSCPEPSDLLNWNAFSRTRRPWNWLDAKKAQPSQTESSAMHSTGHSMLCTMLGTICYAQCWAQYAVHHAGHNMLRTVLGTVCYAQCWARYAMHSAGHNMLCTVLGTICCAHCWAQYAMYSAGHSMLCTLLGTICCAHCWAQYAVHSAGNNTYAVTLMPICMKVECSRSFVGYSALCAEIITDNRHFWRTCLIPRGRRSVESCWSGKDNDFSFRRNLVQFRFERVTCVDVLVGTRCLRQGGMSVASRGNDRDHWCCLLQSGGRVAVSKW